LRQREYKEVTENTNKEKGKMKKLQRKIDRENKRGREEE